MATKSSGNLSPSETYTLGKYSFVMTSGFVNSNMVLTCNALNNGTSSKSSITIHGTNYSFDHWSVSASSKIATVYAYWKRTESPLTPSPFTKPVPRAGIGSVLSLQSVGGNYFTHYLSWTSGGGYIATVKTHTLYRTGVTAVALFASGDPTAVGHCTKVKKSTGTVTTNDDVALTGRYTYDNRTVYYRQYSLPLIFAPPEDALSSSIGWVNNGEVFEETGLSAGAAAWYIVYGAADDSAGGAAIVGRFTIDPDDADETEWDDPGSTGDDSYTLYLDVTGALSGRHNDPLNDTLYHYLPADQEASTVYGSGGDGGYGGGGGGGASSVIIYTCGTDKAGSVEPTAIAKRHGYGSGGGKGGTGGPGCILVYY